MQPMIAIVRDLVEERDIHHDEIEALEIETFHEPAMLLGDESKWSKELTAEKRGSQHSVHGGDRGHLRRRETGTLRRGISSAGGRSPFDGPRDH